MGPARNSGRAGDGGYLYGDRFHPGILSSHHRGVAAGEARAPDSDPLVVHAGFALDVGNGIAIILLLLLRYELGALDSYLRRLDDESRIVALDAASDHRPHQFRKTFREAPAPIVDCHGHQAFLGESIGILLDGYVRTRVSLPKHHRGNSGLELRVEAFRKKNLRVAGEAFAEIHHFLVGDPVTQYILIVNGAQAVLNGLAVLDL